MGELEGIGVKFTPDDVCTILNSSTQCIVASFEAGGAGAMIDIEEDISDTEYFFSYSVNGAVTNTFHFKKISKNKMQEMYGIAETIYTKQE